MTLFNLAKWIAGEVTCVNCTNCMRAKTCRHHGRPKNVDKKIFIVGGAGTGKSMSGMRFAKALARWISFFNHNGIYAHADDYFKFDEDHVAVISTRDLLHVMTKRLKRNSVKIIDDCGAAKGFTNRRSMSNENLDIVSVYGTNRTQNGVAIFCVQDTSFTDLRMRMLADIVIDLTDYYQSGRFRIATLRKIKKDKKYKEGMKPSRFMTYEHGVWVTQETIACEMPDPELKKMYDELRDKKEAENTKIINDKYNQILERQNTEDNKRRCPYCNSTQLYYSEKKNVTKCKGCGRIL